MSYFEFEKDQSKNALMKRQIDLALQSAKMSVNILISGPAGCGKTSLALSIHRHSPFQFSLVFDCESDQQLPQIIPANTTLIIENIDQADEVLQKEILHLLQTEEHIRLIATSRIELRQLVGQGLFRQDLYYKLSIIQIDIPSLSDRPEDLSDIVHYIISFTQIMYMKNNIVLNPAALEKLQNWNWTANIRELENVIERAVCLCQDSIINEKNIIFDEVQNKKYSESLVGMSLSEVEKRLILQTLQLTAQNRTKAAQVLGISIRTLRNKLNEYRQEGVL